MKISTNSYFTILNLEITSGNTKIKEDVADVNGKVPHSLIEEMITATFEMSRFNRLTDVDTCFMIFRAFLTSEEQEQLIELLQP